MYVHDSPFHEPLVLFSHLAAVTRRTEFVTSVEARPHRLPHGLATIRPRSRARVGGRGAPGAPMARLHSAGGVRSAPHPPKGAGFRAVERWWLAHPAGSDGCRYGSPSGAPGAPLPPTRARER